MRHARNATLGGALGLGLWLVACAGSDLPAPSAPSDPANPKAPTTPFDSRDSGPDPFTSDMSAGPARPAVKR